MDNSENPFPTLLNLDYDMLKLNYKDLTPSSTSLIPPLYQDQLGNGINQFAPSDVDWVSLLSCFGPMGDQNYPPRLWPVAGDKNGGENVNASKMKKSGNKGKKVAPQRVAFRTRSVDDILDDGYRWRKYGQKAVKNSIHQRSYYRCTHHTCNVKKQIQRLSKDSGIVVTTYEGTHNHPCEKIMEALTPLLRQLQFLSRI